MKAFYRFTRFSLSLLFKLLYKHRVYGQTHFMPGGAFIASNHNSFFDPPLIAASAPEEIFYLAKKSLFNHPLLGFIISHLNAYPLTGTIQDLAALKLVCKLVQEGKKVLIFPEGYRSADGQLMPFKSGIGMLAWRTHCPVIPTYLHGTCTIWNKEHTLPKLKGQTICVFGSPLYIQPFLHKPKKEAQEAFAIAVQEAIENLRQWYLTTSEGRLL